MKSFTKHGINRIIKDNLGSLCRRKITAARSFTRHEFDRYQVEQLITIYDFAIQHVPFYRENYRSLNTAVVGDIDYLLKQIPIIDKSTVKEANSLFFASGCRLSRIHTTSGTSGTPLRLKASLFEKACFQEVKNDWFRHISRARCPKMLMLAGHFVPGPKNDIMLIDRFTGDIHLSIYSLVDRHRDAITRMLRNERPHIIYGYASAVNELASLVGDEMSAERQHVVAVVTSEVLQPNWKENIEKRLARRAYNFYSSQECCHAVMEGDEGYYHIHPLVGIVELLDEEGNAVREGEVGNVVVTGLLRKSMPLFRYKIGDVAVAAGNRTYSGARLMWPTIADIFGRSEDMVIKEDGSRIGYLCFHATKDINEIREAQLVQTGYRAFICYLVVQHDSEDVGSIENRVRSQIERRMHESVQLRFIYKRTLQRGANEKFKAVVVDFNHQVQDGA